jgi:hypothetical protein
MPLAGCFPVYQTCIVWWIEWPTWKVWNQEGREGFIEFWGSWDIEMGNKGDVHVLGSVSIDGGASRTFTSQLRSSSILYTIYTSIWYCNQWRGKTRTDTIPNVSLPVSFRTKYNTQIWGRKNKTTVGVIHHVQRHGKEKKKKKGRKRERKKRNW